MTPTRELDVFTCPLDGISLIEASAGTGKTWTLCGLYLRLLLERGLEVQRILVVTFTHAATAELRERIRQRIADTLAFLRGRAPESRDPFVPRLVGTLRAASGPSDADMSTRLALALATFDEAAILTIHGFCQRALADTPFSAQMPLAMKLLQDDGELVQEAANDFWRRRVAGDGLDPALAALLAQKKDSPEKFARLLGRHLAKPTASAAWPRAIDVAGEIDAAGLAAAHAAARAPWLREREAIVDSVSGALASLHAGQYKADTVSAAAAGWDELLHGDDALAALALAPAKVDLLGLERLRKATRKGQATPTHPFFAAAQDLLERRAATLQQLQLARLRLLRDLQDEAARALRQGKRQRHVVAFDDMLFNLHQRLSGSDAAWLGAALRTRFPVALVDEFQDTDPQQFAIFDAVYGRGANPLFLVGDPKQAIYSFRNADLHTYLQARRRATAQYTLRANQRSGAPLLAAQNALFGGNPAAFMLAGLDYHAVALGDKPRGRLLDGTEPRGALHVWMLPDDPASSAPLLKAQAQQAAVRACAAEIARLLGAARRGELMLDEQPLRADDIAVLVRSHGDGGMARQALAALGVGSVELSQASVFASADAEELERLLAAVLDPARGRRLKAALSTQAMGRDAAALDTLDADAPQLLAIVQRFAGYRETWLQRGVGVMLRQWLVAEQVAERLLARADGERRLTNWLHLSECLHQAAEVHAAPDALLRWLQSQRADDRGSDATQLRLESDQNLVQIVTIHKSKGLEFPIVFCPLLWNARAGGAADGLDGVEYHDDAGQAVIDYRQGFDGEFDDAAVKARVKLEASAESLRLIYVALTRAVHRCMLVAGCYQVKSGSSASSTESTRSLLNWLVAGAGRSPQQWFDGRPTPHDIAAAWGRLAERAAGHVVIAPLPLEAGTPLPAQRPAPEMLAALPPPQPLPQAWRIGSYSGLVHGAMHEQAAADHDLRVAPAAAGPAAPPARLDDDDILRFPRGAAAGVCLHSVFERIDFTDPAGWPAAIDSALRALRSGLPPPALAPAAASDAPPARMLQRLLRDVLATPLPVGTAQPLRLSQLPRQRRLTELEFHLPTHRLDAATLNRTLASLGYAAPRLAFATLRGYLKGFIDMVFEHDGRYFIADWKSNHLGDRPAQYAPAALELVMTEQGYHLQSLLYCVALDRHLRRRLPQYQPAQQFGGALYLFVRGVRPQWRDDDGRPSGLHFHRPAPEALQRMSALFDAAGVPA